MNYYKKHLYVILEDEQYQKIMNGVNLSFHVKDDVIKISNFSGGWRKVFKDFLGLISLMSKFPERHILLLIDFDYEFESRLVKFRNSVPNELQRRVFILGIDNKESEDLARLFKCNIEEVGKKLVEDCPDGDLSAWKNIHLECNLPEIERMKQSGIFDWLFVK